MAIEKFSKDHEWIRVEGDVATIGITVHAQDQLGDVVFVEVPEVGRKVSAEEAVAVVESVKAASDVYSPLTGEVIEANGDLAATPGLLRWWARLETKLVACAEACTSTQVSASYRLIALPHAGHETDPSASFGVAWTSAEFCPRLTRRTDRYRRSCFLQQSNLHKVRTAGPYNRCDL